jgi:hypothetical protein
VEYGNLRIWEGISINFRLNNLQLIENLNIKSSSKSIEILIISNFSYLKMKEFLLTLILYVIQNNTNTRVVFNTYEKYDLRMKERDGSLESMD